MNLILSTKASKKLRREGHSIEDFSPDLNTWRIDCATLVQRSIFIVTKEQTLYTCISSYKDGFKGIIQKISATIKCEIDVNEINYVKFQNRSVVGSMNNMKKLIQNVDAYYPSDNESYEQLVNRTPFQYLSQRSPAEVHSLITDNYSA